MTADGSDLVTVIAAVADENGNIKRLNNYHIQFEIEGPGTLVADKTTFTNPRRTEWGTAPVLVRATAQTGEIKVRASLIWQGKHTPVSSELVLPVRKADHPLIAHPKELEQIGKVSTPVRFEETSADQKKRIESLMQEINRLKLKEVERQQSDFE